MLALPRKKLSSIVAVTLDLGDRGWTTYRVIPQEGVVSFSHILHFSSFANRDKRKPEMGRRSAKTIEAHGVPKFYTRESASFRILGW